MQYYHFYRDTCPTIINSERVTKYSTNQSYYWPPELIQLYSLVWRGLRPNYGK